MGATSPLGVAQGQWFGIPNGLPNAPATGLKLVNLPDADGFADRIEFVMKPEGAANACCCFN